MTFMEKIINYYYKTLSKTQENDEKYCVYGEDANDHKYIKCPKINLRIQHNSHQKTFMGIINSNFGVEKT